MIITINFYCYLEIQDYLHLLDANFSLLPTCNTEIVAFIECIPLLELA
jgi:hypothetical protein